MPSIHYLGGGGDDVFDVLRNRCILDLNGESGDDSFIVRSFIAVIAEDGSYVEPDVGEVKIEGGEDNDLFYVENEEDTTINNQDTASYSGMSIFDVDPLETPNFVINSLVRSMKCIYPFPLLHLQQRVLTHSCSAIQPR